MPIGKLGIPTVVLLVPDVPALPLGAKEALRLPERVATRMDVLVQVPKGFLRSRLHVFLLRQTTKV